MCKSVNAVIVAFNPDLDRLTKLIDSICYQVNKVLIVNNGQLLDVSLTNYVNVEVYNLGDNLGIAYASNFGLEKSREIGGEYVLLSDQDTVFPCGYIKSLLSLFAPNTAAAAPAFLDSISGKRFPFYVDSKIFFKQLHIESGYVEAFQAIASGLIIKHEYLKDIGCFNADLFIDWVDFEWCWRARSKGYQIIGNADVVIQHQLGDASKDIGFREVNLRSPVRHYYITRNAFYLALYCNHLDIGHRINLFFKSFRYIVGYPILSRPHLKNLRAVLLGFYHGITRRLGKYNL